METETITTVKMSFTSMSAAAAANAKMAGIFDGHFAANDMALFCDALATTNFFQQSIQNGKVLMVTRHAVGVRVALSVVGAKAELSLDLPSIAASAAIEGTRVQYELQAIGITQEIAGQILKTVPKSGALTPQTFAGLQTLLTKTLPEYFRTLPAVLSANDVGVLSLGPAGITNMDRFGRAREINRAMTEIARGNRLRAALSAPGADADITRLVYAERAGKSDATIDEPPSSESQRQANLWLSGQ